MTTTLFSRGPVRRPGRTPRTEARIAPPRDYTTLGAGGVVAVFLVLAALGPLIVPHDPNAVAPLNVNAGASTVHLLGTDDTGRDILSRLIAGTRSSLAAPAVVILISTTLGTVLALTAAWAGGRTDRFVSGALDVVFGFPGLIMAVLAAAVFGAGLTAPIVALSIAYLPLITRVVRSAAIKERNLPYVSALQLLGAPTHRIWLRHLLPNLLPFVLVQATIGFGYALLDVAAISFLGLGSQPPDPEWGLMVSNGAPSILAGQPQQSLYAGLVILVVVVAFNLLGTGLSRRLLGEDA
ncbi:ABC transporter permease [Streptomyces sp. ISL-96]|uniref:ABC transporter permease n=1 Tax=Streptomyces sp. ISL-96 TaxID=2819191 RepID=UPI001BE53CED|nr:ABC transporter permease [Streptomyces sp. ISL-96]MBT2489763.1 ABC transporter permease [Streptomyces sp. ISL-96]